MVGKLTQQEKVELVFNFGNGVATCRSAAETVSIDVV